MSTSSVGWVIVPDSVTFVETMSASGTPVSVLFYIYLLHKFLNWI
jgi:hypothetical protein